MVRIRNAGLFLLEGDLGFQLFRHPFEFRHHHLQLLQLPALFIHLKFFQAH